MTNDPTALIKIVRAKLNILEICGYVGDMDEGHEALTALETALNKQADAIASVQHGAVAEDAWRDEMLDALLQAVGWYKLAYPTRDNFESLLAKAKQGSVPEWRTIEDCPKVYGIYKVKLKDETETIALYQNYYQWGWSTPVVINGGGRANWFGTESCTPTHWMPLPAAPSISNDASEVTP